MIYLLLKFYKEELSTYNIVFKHMKFWFYTLILSPIISGSIVVLFSIRNNQFYQKSLLFSILVSLFIVSIPFNISAKKIAEKLLKVSSDELMWNSYKVIYALRKKRKEELYDYINEIHKNINLEDIKKLSELASCTAEESKTKFPLIPSIFAALFISLWNNFITWIYKYENIKLFDDALDIFISISLLLIVLIILLISIKMLLNEIVEDLINKDSKKMKELSELLKEIYEDKIRVRNISI